MKTTVVIDIEKLPEDRLLAFHTVVGEATLGERTFEVTRSLNGTHLSFREQVGDRLVVHTLDLSPVIQAALVEIASPAADVVPGSGEDLLRTEPGL